MLRKHRLPVAAALLLIVSGGSMMLFTDNQAPSGAGASLLHDGSYLGRQAGEPIRAPVASAPPTREAEVPAVIPAAQETAPPRPTAGNAAATGASTAAYLWEPVRVNNGDTMASIFQRLSLSPTLLHRIVTLDDKTRSLRDLRAGEMLSFAWHEDGSLAALKRSQEEDAWLLVERDPAGDLQSRLLGRDLETRQVEAAAVVRNNLFAAGQRAGMSDALIMRMAGIFGWDIDFALDIRNGDRFGVIYEEIWRDGQFLRDGDIIAARFTNQGKTFTALRFTVDGRSAYYTPAGRPMRKAFLRAPLNFTRVTSNFNPRRYHPILKRRRPHNGTDYGAPAGTPVYASGDGTVIDSAYNSANGHYVFIRHRNDIVTRYLHFSKRLVKRGDRVRQGQVIGRVGSTGLASGPHLHYEFLVRGRHRNPRTVNLPDDPPLSSDLVARLRQQHGHLVDDLARLDSELQLRLLAESENPDSSESHADRQQRRKAVVGPGL